MNEADVIDRLKAAGPHKVIAILADGETKQPIAVPAKGQRWARVWARVSQLAWSELLCLDAKGGLLDRILNDGPAGDLEPVGKGSDDASTVQLGHLFERLAREVVKTTVTGMQTMKNTGREEMKDILDAHKDLARNAFELHASAVAAHAKERAAWEAEREQLLATILDLKTQLIDWQHKREPSSADKREEQLFSMLSGASGGALAPGAVAGGSNGTPLGG